MGLHLPLDASGALICREAAPVEIDFDKRVETWEIQILGQPVVPIRFRPRRRYDFKSDPRVIEAALGRILGRGVSRIAIDRRPSAPERRQSARIGLLGMRIRRETRRPLRLRLPTGSSM